VVRAVGPPGVVGRERQGMSILVERKSRVICQGITGKAGAFHTKQCIEYGTNFVGGVTPGKGGQKSEHGLPIFNTCHEAVAATGADVSMIFVPAGGAAEAAMEAADAGIRLVVLITEGIPTLDMVKARKYLDDKGVQLVGPNCPGVITPGQAKIGIMPGYIHKPVEASTKNVGLISRSGTLTYEAVWQCSQRGYAQTTCVGIGGDPVKGLNFIELLDLFNADPETHAIVMIGEIGGTDEEQAAAHIKRQVRKPVVAFIAGRTAPPGKRMGHAGAIISGGEGTADSKIAALRAAGITVCDSPALIGETVAKVLG
jgi:succinyl-CoA synthetase alpha subunit